MSIIDEIKRKLDIVDVIGRDMKLHKAGKLLKGLCPFHTEKTGSFFVYAESQRYKCFGCNVSGDVLDYKMTVEGWDLQTAIRELAREAGVTLKPLTVEEQRVVLRTREKEKVFAAAAAFFAANLAQWVEKDGAYVLRGEVSPGLAYARSRGWDDETIRLEGLGYFGRDWNGLKRWLLDEKVDLACPAAVALVGFRGDVSQWGRHWSVEVSADWVKAGKIPAMVPEVLVYPHVVGGRVVYLSGRTIPNEDVEVEDARPKSWNPRIALVGDKLPFFNRWWGKRLGPDKKALPFSVLVEGQGCAVTLGQWGIPALALAGVY